MTGAERGDALVLINAKAGTVLQRGADATVAEIRSAFAEGGYRVDIRCLHPAEMEPAITAAAGSADLSLLVAGGGDGTLSMAASKLVNREIALGCLPLGTMNLYCRSLGVPPDPVMAARALGEGRIERVDVGEVNGRTFLHHVSLGLQPAIVAQRDRESYSGRSGKIFATLKSAFRALRNPRILDVTLDLPEGRERHAVPALFVTSNPLLKHTPGIAQSRTARRLGIYICRSARWDEILQVGAEVMLTGWEEAESLDVREATELTIARNRHSRRGFRASVDGELIRFRSPMKLVCRRGALRLLVPQ